MIHYCVVRTHLGYAGLLSRDGRLTRLMLPRPSRRQALAEITAGLTGPAVEDVRAFGDLPERLRRYFQGERVDFGDVQLDLSGCGPFQARAILAARTIPYGTVITYGGLARIAGSPKAARAAGAAMAANRTPIIVPCHRVIASGGRIGGYASGLEWKRELLRIEGIDI